VSLGAFSVELSVTELRTFLFGTYFVPCVSVKPYIFIFLLFLSPSIMAQMTDMEAEDNSSYEAKKANNVTVYNNLINEAIKVHTGNNFMLYKEQRIKMQNREGKIIHMDLEAGQWYHFVFIGDPSCKKLKVTLFKEGVGDFVTDKTGSRNEEFYTEFSFIAPVSGMYEFTCFQKGEMDNPLAYLMLFKKNGQGGRASGAKSETPYP
jgi:hypothetical protein